MHLLASSRIGVVDGAVLIGYAALLLLVGWHFSRRTRSVDDYLLGGRGMRSWTVGLSLFASLLSAISYLAHPEEMLDKGPMFIAGYCAYPFVIGVVGWILIPAIVSANVQSAYEILDRRLGPSVGLFGSVIFLALRLIWMAVIVFLLATKIITPIFGLEESPDAALWVSALVGVVTVVYTSMGGLRAVVLTDVVQTFILLGGAVVTIAIVHFDVGGFSGWWPTEWHEEWHPPRFFHNEDDPQKRTFFWAGLSVFTWYVCTAGSDQVAVQRYLATKDARAARRAFITSMSADIVSTSLLGLVGLALLAYFGAHPELAPPEPGPGEAKVNPFMHFIATSLPVGVTGLVVAGLLAAAMSSLSSGVNSVSSVLSVDFVGRFRPRERTEREKVRIARSCSWGIGLVVVLLSLAVGQVAEGAGLLDKIFRTVNLLVAPLFVLFFLALFVRPATAPGAIVGGALSILTAVAIAFGWVGEVSVLWIMPSAFVAGVVTGALASVLLGSLEGLGFRGPTGGAS